MRRDLVADALWYSSRSPHRLGEQPERRPKFVRAMGWAKKFHVGAKTKDLRLFHDLPPRSGSCRNFRAGGGMGKRRAVFATRAAKGVGGWRMARTVFHR